MASDRKSCDSSVAVTMRRIPTRTTSRAFTKLALPAQIATTANQNGKVSARPNVTS